MSETRIQQDGVDVMYVPEFAPASFEALRSELAWEQPMIRVFGRTQPVCRHVAWHADPGYGYRYSGIDSTRNPWTPTTSALRAQVERRWGSRQGVLANRYDHGQHSVAPHADDESDLVQGAAIILLSFGGTRRFVVKHRETKERHVFELEDRSALVMAGATNSVAVHSIPKTGRQVDPRISLTFRAMVRRTGA